MRPVTYPNPQMKLFTIKNELSKLLYMARIGKSKGDQVIDLGENKILVPTKFKANFQPTFFNIVIA